MVLVSLPRDSFKGNQFFFSVLFISLLFVPALFSAINRISLAQARIFVFDEVKIVTRLSLFDAR